MRKLVVLFFLAFSISSAAQDNSVKATLSRIFISIPDTFFSPLKSNMSDSVRMDKALRQSLIDTLRVIENGYQPLHFTGFDTVNCYLWLLAKQGEPEGKTVQIAYWNRTDGTRLVMMVINFSDMCVLEQTHRHFWIDNGTELTAIDEREVMPDLSNRTFISKRFLKKHKKAREEKMPYMILRSDEKNSVTYFPALDYLFACREYFIDDPWYELERKDFVCDFLLLYWNGNKFSTTKPQ